VRALISGRSLSIGGGPVNRSRASGRAGGCSFCGIAECAGAVADQLWGRVGSRGLATARIGLVSGRAESIAQIANREGVTDRYVSRMLEFALLPPVFIKAVLDGD
jgi:hypothetical protein